MGADDNFLRKLARTLHGVWRRGFAEQILGIRGGDCSMTSISDLKFIIPIWARVFEVAYEKMSQDDYLLIAAIWCKLNRTYLRVKNWNRIGSLENSDRYTFRITSDKFHPAEYDLEVDILLDGVAVAQWSDSYSTWRPRSKCCSRPLENAEAVILSALGMNKDSVLGIDPPDGGMEVALPKLEHRFGSNWNSPDLSLCQIQSHWRCLVWFMLFFGMEQSRSEFLLNWNVSALLASN